MKKKDKLTNVQKRALSIIDVGIGSPTDFAKEMWPDSAGWQQSIKCGAYGSSRGGGMSRAYLGKLRKLGLVSETLGYDSQRIFFITQKGRNLMNIDIIGSNKS